MVILLMCMVLDTMQLVIASVAASRGKRMGLARMAEQSAQRHSMYAREA
ncbi:hypothetical protein [Paraburkholderia caribensis]|uniref:Uncharacterized protein n=1 Tax=Paraburkholderia caribensis TaxID=75105 RepID=A0ABV0E263_9BURK|nr:hypothetical protein [Paraburkholderia caribensis]MCO4876662.1 hypothetical protein [Paraburkholderia caribensis]